MLKIGLIGCGEHSRIAHGPAWARLARERGGAIGLVGACDLDLARAEEYCGLFGFGKAYADWEEMVERERPDACVAVMPVHLTAGLAETLLRRGMPCVIEKPMGSDIGEVRRLAAVAKETGTKHMVSVNRRFLPHLNKAKAWALEKGELRFVSATMLRVGRTEADFVWGTGMHVVDGLRHLVGEVRDFAIQRSGGSAGTHAWYLAGFGFGKEGMGQLAVLPTCGVADEIYELMGEGFRARVSTKQDGVTTLQCWEGDELRVDEGTDLGEEPFVFRGEYAEATELVEALLGGRMPRPTVGDVLPSAELCAKLLGG